MHYTVSSDLFRSPFVRISPILTGYKTKSSNWWKGTCSNAPILLNDPCFFGLDGADIISIISSSNGCNKSVKRIQESFLYVYFR